MIQLILWIFAAGAVGGFFNALISENGFVLPKKETSDNKSIIRFGSIVNVLLGGGAALISWGLYGPLAAVTVLGAKTGGEATISLSLTALAGALLIGVGGSRWLTNEVDKKLLRATAAEAAKAPVSHNLSRDIAVFSPLMAFRAAQANLKDMGK